MSFNVNLSSTTGNSTIGATTPVSISTNGILTVANTTDSTSSITGALLISGGIGISDAADATSSTNGGSFTSAGGGAFAKSLFVGTSTNLATSSGVTTIGSSTAATISATGVLTIANTTNSTTISTGSIITSGGVGVAQSLWVGTGVNLATSSGVTTIGSSTAATISATGVLTIANTTNATSISSGSIITSGGVGIAQSLWVGTATNLATSSGITTIGSSTALTISATGLLAVTNATSIVNANSYSSTSGSVNINGDLTLYNSTKNTLAFTSAGVAAPAFTTRSNGTKILLYPNISGSAVDYGIGIESNSIWFTLPDTSSSLFYYWYGGTTRNMSLSGSGALSLLISTSIGNSTSFTGTGGCLNLNGDITLYNSTKNTIAFRNTGVAAPSFTTRSNGTKILLWPNLSGVAVDFAIGIETLGIWNSVPTSAQKFYWYAGTTEIMRLDGTSTGILNVNGTTTSTSSTTGSFVTAGGIATSNTTDATSSTNGGTFTSAGGGAFAKKLFVGTDLSVGGALSKGSGTFDIEHPIDSSKRLVHSFVEGPRCDNIYRGEVTLVEGIAEVNLDKDCVAEEECRMTEGTFQALNRNISYFLQNKTSFSPVIGKIEGNRLTIICSEKETGTVISWIVIGERKDSHIINWDKTNEKGYLITEHQI